MHALLQQTGQVDTAKIPPLNSSVAPRRSVYLWIYIYIYIYILYSVYIPMSVGLWLTIVLRIAI